ncbi:MAG: hypothetical protein JKY34_01245 [Kordiimonadaceae bacterium]|nr:hypothetical protein [Kordiimonadaceae bacterium]
MIQDKYKPISNTETYPDKPTTTSTTSTAFENAESSKDWISKKGKVIVGRELERFKAFWDAFGLKNDRAEAIDEWLAIKQRVALFDTIIAAAKAEAQRRPALEARKLSPKWAQGWLSGRRWENEENQTKAALVFDPSNPEHWRAKLGPTDNKFMKAQARDNWPSGCGPNPHEKQNKAIPAEIYGEYAEAWGWI